MCGRYTLKTPAEVLVEAFDLEETPELAPRYNIAPSQEVPVVRVSPEGGRRLDLMRWGLVPSWARDPAIGNRMINARAETAASKPSFRSAFRKRRCLVLADGFYEWRREGETKRPWHIRLRDGSPFAFAGLWEVWRGSGTEPLRSCALLTTRPNALLARVHDRMPVILAPESYASWLDPKACRPEDVQALLAPYSAEALEAFPVSRHVNRPAHDDPACIEPLGDWDGSLPPPTDTG